MVEEYGDFGKISQETIFGWYPGGGEKPRNDPKDIYANLGSRPPRDRSYHESSMIYQHHKDYPAQLNKRGQDYDDYAVRPPYAQDYPPQPNRPISDDDVRKKLIDRAKSAPLNRNVPTHRNVLNIPPPKLYNHFDSEGKQKLIDNTGNSNQSNENQQLENALGDNFEEDQNETEIGQSLADCEFPYYNIIEINNSGKKPIINTENDKSTKSTHSLRSASKMSRSKTALEFSKSSLVDYSCEVTSDRVINANNKVPRHPSATKSRPKTSFNRPKSSSTKKLNEIQHRNNPTNDHIEYLRAKSMCRKDNHSKVRQSEVENVEIPINTIEKYHNQPEIVSPNSNFDKKYSCTVVKGHWKDDLLNREKYLQKRPNYFVRIDIDKLKPDRQAPEIHYNAPDTYFYNTMPFRNATFSINPHFISENLNVKKIDIQNRPPSTSPNSYAPIKYRRDYAFVY